MEFRLATKTDLQSVITWIPDAESCLVWAGPRVRFPLEPDQAYADLELDSIRTYAFCDETDLFALGQVRLFDNDRGHLSRIIVNPLHRTKGIGRSFVQHLIEEARALGCHTITLHVVKENSTAIGLYRKLGFYIPTKQPHGLRDGIYYMEIG
jgi:ribosomal-protein-alanine N-acetyltransferase